MITSPNVLSVVVIKLITTIDCLIVMYSYIHVKSFCQGDRLMLHLKFFILHVFPYVNSYLPGRQVDAAFKNFILHVFP